METLLAHSFDYLSSYEPSKVRKGLRQVEGLLAQICLSKAKQSQSPVVRKRSVMTGSPQPGPRPLSELKDDPAFREFFKLQEGFQWNGKSSARSVFYRNLDGTDKFSGIATGHLSRTSTGPREQWHQRPTHYFDSRSHPRRSTSSSAIANTLCARNLHEPTP